MENEKNRLQIYVATEDGDEVLITYNFFDDKGYLVESGVVETLNIMETNTRTITSTGE